nr:transposase (putative), gypsy type [Tanacetum cinerariifolium]
MPSSFECLPLLRDASNNTIVWPDWEAGAGSNSEMEIEENSVVKEQDLVEYGELLPAPASQSGHTIVLFKASRKKGKHSKLEGIAIVTACPMLLKKCIACDNPSLRVKIIKWHATLEVWYSSQMRNILYLPHKPMELCKSLRYGAYLGDTVQLETAVSTISQEYLLEFTSEYGISEALHPKLPGPEDRIIDFPKGKNNRFFWVNERVFPTILDWLTSALKDGMPTENTYSPEAVMILNTHRTPIQKQPEALLCLVGLSRRYYLGDEVYPTFLHDDDLDMDLFNLIRAPNPTKVKTGSRPCTAHEVSLLTVTTNRVIEMEDLATTTDLSGVPSTIERSPLDFAIENPSQQSTGPEDQEVAAPEVPHPENVTTTGVAPKAGQAERVAATGPPVAKERRKRGHDGVDTNVPPRSSNGAAAARNPESENTSFTSMVGSPESIYRPEWGITNGCMLDAPEAFQDLVAMGSQLQLRFEQEAKLLKKSVAQVARRDKMIQARENEIKNLETLLEAETDMKKAVSTLQEQVMGEEKLKSTFKEFKQYEDNRVEQRCAELDACLDALSIDFDEELYLHKLTVIAGRRWVIGRGLRLAVMKCGESTELRQVFAEVVLAGIAKGMSEGLKHGVEHEKAKLDLEAIEAHDPEAEAKYIAALHALKNLKYPLVDQLKSLKDAPMDVIMSSSHLESDTEDDAP